MLILFREEEELDLMFDTAQGELKSTLAQAEEI